MSKRVEQNHPRTNTRLLTLGRRQLAVVAAGVSLVVVVAAVLLYPDLYIQYIRNFGIRQFEAQYAFRTGPVPVRSNSQQTETHWGIVWVAPEGAFARLGVRGGDIPFAYHGGVTDMYSALKRASLGGASSFQVYNAADAHLGRVALRDVNLPPAPGVRPATR